MKDFGPFMALLEKIPAVYANHKVRQRFPTRYSCSSLIHLQDSLSLKNKAAVLLSHITSLDALFVTGPDDVPELRRRDKLIRYVMIKPFDTWS